MELYILSKTDLSIKSILKPSDYEINLDEETNAKTTFVLKKCNGLKEGNFIVVNGLYKQFLFVIPPGGITTEKGSNIVTVTALDISNIFDRKIIKKDTDLMTNNSIEEFLAKTISENFVNSNDPYLNIPYMLINWKTETKAVVDTNAENGLYNFHTFLINCRQYKNICTDFKFKEKIKESYRTAQGKKIEIQNGKKGTHLLITTKGETTQATRSGKNRLPYNYYDGNSKTVNGITFTVNKDKSITANGTATANASFSITNPNNYAIAAGSYKLIGENNTYTKQAIRGSYKKADGTITYIGSATSSFTIPEGATNVHIYVVILQGETVNNVTFYPMLLNSTETDLTFEAGGASPSLDYRSPIENVEGKNKFDKNNMVEATWDNGKTNTVTLLEDGRIQSTANYAQWAAKCIDIPNLKANTDYVVSGKIISSTADNAMIIVKGYKNNTLSNIIYHRYAVETRFELSFNSSDYEKIGISLSGDNSTLDTTYTTIFDEIQLEEGTVATDYVPYNSLEIKDVGENLLNVTAKTTTVQGLTFTVNEDKSITINGTNTGTGTAFFRLADNFVLPAGDYTLSNKNENASDDSFMFYDDNYNFVTKNISNATFTKDTTIKPYIRVKAGVTVNNQTIYPMILKGTYTEETIPAYKPYQEQKVDFPLSEGQKLYKASYLANNGIHHNRAQTTVNISNIVTLSNGNIGGIFQPAGKKYSDNNGLCCDKAKYDPNRRFVTDTVYENSGNVVFVGNSTDTLETLKAKYDGAILEYELSEEKIIPYTEEQQEAWNKIEELMMFEGYNSIESNAQLDIKYNYIYPENAKLIIDIENKEDNIAIIDTTLAEVTDSNKIYEANYTAKVQVLIREDNSIYNLYLKTDRTTTENKDDPDRASGKIETISVDTADKAREEALNVMKGNTYKHLVEFKIPKTSKLIDMTKLYIGRKVKIKTEDDIYDSYISAITLNDENFVYFKSGNLRVDLLDKLKKQKESVGNKLDVEGGTIKSLKIEKDLDINGNYYKNGKKIDTEIQITTGKEYATNEYIDGKRVYIKQLEFNDTVSGGLDNRLVKSHGIVGAEKIWIDLSNSYIKATTTNATYPLPVILYSGNISALSIIVDLTNIYMESQGGWGTIWTKVIRLKYTKAEEV